LSTTSVLILLCANFIYWKQKVFNYIFGLILCVQNAHMYLLLQVKKHKYHLHLVVTLAHYSLMIFSNFGSGEHKHRDRKRERDVPSAWLPVCWDWDSIQGGTGFELWLWLSILMLT